MAREHPTDFVAEQVARDLQHFSNQNSLPHQSRLDFSYDEEFVADDDYRASLPDLQNGAQITGTPIKLERVGIHNFRLPIKYLQRDSDELIEWETSVTGTVSLEASLKGINMSRIIRTFYEHRDANFTIDNLGEILMAYKRQLTSLEAQISASFSYPIMQRSLRSNLEGFQYYDVTTEMAVDAADRLKKALHFDFVYSSACPRSFELAEHARHNRSKATVSHSQRSVARISVKFDEMIWIEELKDLCTRALSTETQVMVRREDEQAFAELNGAHLKFVEDAVRLLWHELDKDQRVLDFRIVCSHLESLHSHDAVAVATKGIPDGFTTDVSFHEWRSLIR